MISFSFFFEFIVSLIILLKIQTPNSSVLNSFSNWKFSDDCKQGEFKCGIGYCIPDSWVCDGQSDCPDDLDENVDRCTWTNF